MILVTGGLGYIGSHMCVELLENNYDVVVLDNLSNSCIEPLNRIKMITNKSVKFYEGDICDVDLLDKIFLTEKIDSVIHFAGLKSVGESSIIPLKYYSNNVSGTLNLLITMKKYDVKNIIFSSSATVYGNAKSVPYYEYFETGSTTNPYATSKLICEMMLKDLYASDNTWNIIILRYFNPIGAHKSGLIGEDPNGIPNNLLPFVSQVAIGKLKELSVYGNDYPTKDGTGVRDYIHVADLANAHLKSLQRIENKTGLEIFNIGTGVGISVLEIIKTFENVCNVTIPYKFVEKRNGDLPSYYANCQKANDVMGFTAKYGIEDMCKDIWNWQTKNPNGYSK